MIKLSLRRCALVGFAALCAAVAAGCASVNYSSAGMLKNMTVKGTPGAEAGQAVTITTSGYYILWTIPLVSGDLRWNEETREIKGGTSFFCDQVGFNELQTALLNIAESRNCDLADVYFSDSDGFYAGPSYGGAVGTLFGSSHMGVSAILVPRKAAAK